MRITSFLIVSVLSFLSHAFPMKPQSPKQPAFRRRVAYSVVAVDGGSATTTSAAIVPDILTLIRTSDSIETITDLASSTPRSIETLVVTKVISEMEPAKTVYISLTQDASKSPSSIITTSYAVIDPAEIPTTSSTLPLTSQIYTSVPSESCVTSFSTSTVTPSSNIFSSTLTVFTPIASSSQASENAPPPDAEGLEAAARTSASPAPPAITNLSTVLTDSTKTYDDGRWHTSYPVWNATSTVHSGNSTTAVSTGRAPNLWKKG